MKKCAKGVGLRDYYVAVLRSRAYKSFRDEQSGIMRSFAARPNMHAVFVGKDTLSPSDKIDFDAIIGVPRNFDKRHLDSSQGIALDRNSAQDRSADKSACPFPSISVDNGEIARTAADLLIRRGHVHFAYIGTDLRSEGAYDLQRADAFSRFVADRGYDCSRYAFKATAHSKRETARLIKFIATLPIPCGIMVYADNMARPVMDACRHLHLSIPGQVAIVGVDNETEICENLMPPLTSVLPDFEMAGYLAAEMVAKMLAGERIARRDITYGVKAVIERESTQDLRGGGRLVTLATEFMRKNFACKINVSDVAKKLNVSRRLLEIRFREIRGQTAWQCLSDIRIAEAKRKLEKTSLPVGEIMRGCGYGTYKPFRLAFVAATGTTPARWRKSHLADGIPDHPPKRGKRSPPSTALSTN